MCSRGGHRRQTGSVHFVQVILQEGMKKMTTRIHQLNLVIKSLFQIWPTLFVVVKNLLEVDYYTSRSHGRVNPTVTRFHLDGRDLTPSPSRTKLAWNFFFSDCSVVSLFSFSVSWPWIDMGSPSAGFPSYTCFIFIRPSLAAVSWQIWKVEAKIHFPVS